ncbi:hypothetical protein [Xylophilus ampelinus]|uniref:Uncharacterized protein n=1 Tax=Xylophilus ampelinus TaxID=54067 RepID=A0A318SKR7_9BURK|nr:hypothetical protein [Xylophilus ampelinus]PYE76102.1 hypothetical protein DFQ15_11663 [Xylophilus ampelinus]
MVVVAGLRAWHRAVDAERKPLEEIAGPVDEPLPPAHAERS